jgi:carboxyl-terminal processing protease
MHPSLRFTLVFLVPSVLSAGWVHQRGADVAVSITPLDAVAAASPEYRAHELVLLRETLRYVRDGYVEPERIDPERMLVGALEEVERTIPAVMFRRDGTIVTARVGPVRSTLVIELPRRVDDLPDSLAPVAALLRRHLSPSDIPNPDPNLDPYAMIELAMANGALATLDPHSMVLPPEAAREMDVENRGEFGGLGINIEMVDGSLIIEYPVPETPAGRADLRDGDRVRRIDRQPVANVSLDEAIEMLRGPVGEAVTLEIEREGVPQPFEVTLQRASIQVAPVEAFPLGGGMGYVRIRSFHSSTAAELRAELAALTRTEGPLRGLVLDLRDNPGGYLTQAIAVANLFLIDGEIVATRGPHDLTPRAEFADASDAEVTCPLAVLVSAGSASASEVVAGALRNHERAVIIGERTFGKGSVQNLHDISWDSKLKITVAQYLTPGERSIQSVGVSADVELIPVWIDGAEGVSLFSREAVRREADLLAHLAASMEAASPPPGPSAWRIRYRVHEADAGATPPRPWDPPNLRADEPLAVAIAMLQVASSPRRPEMLDAATRWLRRERSSQDQRIAAAMAEIGVDWTDGPDPAMPLLDLALDVGPDGALAAGRRATVKLSVTNRGAEPLHRLVAVAGEHELFEGREFVFGYLPAGETRTVTASIDVPDGYPAERSDVVFSLRGAEGGEIGRDAVRVATDARPLPRLQWRWRVEEPADGRIDVGDVVAVHVDVENVGDGPTRAATVRLKSTSGRGLDVISGRFDPGELRDWSGAVCAEAGPDCAGVLMPGARVSGALTVRVMESAIDGYTVGLSVEDQAAYDHAAAHRNGFEEIRRYEEAVRFSLGDLPEPSGLRAPPQIEISLAPGLESEVERVTLSGRATDDEGLAWVMIHVGQDKVYFQGNDPVDGVRSVPFTADAWMRPGRNTISVLATDGAGFSTAVSRVVWLDTPSLRAAAP